MDLTDEYGRHTGHTGLWRRTFTAEPARAPGRLAPVGSDVHGLTGVPLGVRPHSVVGQPLISSLFTVPLGCSSHSDNAYHEDQSGDESAGSKLFEQSWYQHYGRHAEHPRANDE